MSFTVRFWGVRGSIACPTSNHIGFGGNTSCVEVACGETRIVFDAGTGIRDLGHCFMRTDVTDATILLSHTHWDHINGFPFFSPAFQADHELRIMAGHLSDAGGIRNVLAGQMANPMFPVPIDAMRSKMTFADFRAGDTFALPGEPRIRVATAPLNHPNGGTGYRIEYGGKALCYVTDTEHEIDAPNQNVLGLIEGADMVIYDCTYTDEEFPAKIGWGHSTWEEGIRLCRAANVRQLAIFHHDPDHEDAFMTEIEKKARDAWHGAFVARENMRLNLA